MALVTVEHRLTHAHIPSPHVSGERWAGERRNTGPRAGLYDSINTESRSSSLSTVTFTTRYLRTTCGDVHAINRTLDPLFSTMALGDF